MAEPCITAELVRQLFHYDPETGLFTNLVKRGPRAMIGQMAGSLTSNGYIEIMISGYHIKASRLACLYMTGAWPRYEMDHINRDTIDNRWSNLRDVTHCENISNRSWRPSASKIA